MNKEANTTLMNNPGSSPQTSKTYRGIIPSKKMDCSFINGAKILPKTSGPTIKAIKPAIIELGKKVSVIEKSSSAILFL